MGCQHVGELLEDTQTSTVSLKQLSYDGTDVILVLV